MLFIGIGYRPSAMCHLPFAIEERSLPMNRKVLSLIIAFTSFALSLHAEPSLPGTQPLTLQGDLSAQMVAGIDKFLLRQIEQSISERQRFWKRDFSSPDAYEKSVQTNRARLRKMI